MLLTQYIPGVALTSEQLDRVIAALKARCDVLECPLCHTHKWTIGDGIAAITIQETPTEVVGAQVPARYLPAFTIYCDHCGGIQFISTNKLAELTDISDMLSPKRPLRIPALPPGNAGQR